MAGQQRRKSSYSQIPLSAPKVPGNMSWVVDSAAGNVITVLLGGQTAKCFLVGVPSFSFSQAGLRVVTATLVDNVLTLVVSDVVVLPLQISLGVNDKALRNFYGGFLSSQQVDVVPAPVPPSSYNVSLYAWDSTSVQLQNSTDGRWLLGNRASPVFINGNPVFVDNVSGYGTQIVLIYNTGFNLGDVIQMFGGDTWMVASDGGLVGAQIITLV